MHFLETAAPAQAVLVFAGLFYADLLEILMLF
jgi:hypothetical protein